MSSSKTYILHFYIFTLLVITIPYIVSSHNITEILDSDSDSDFSDFNHYLTLTNIANEVNSRLTITVLAVSNSALSSFLSSNLSISAIKNILSLHVLLDYYDAEKLRAMKNRVATSTTLYQTTGVAEDKTGQVNITEFKNGTIGFGSAQPGLKPGPKFVREIRTIPFKISVLEINAPIIVPSLLTSGSLDPDVSAILDKEGFEKFLSLLTSTGVLKVYKEQLRNGITIFAPTDMAFKAQRKPNISNFSQSDMVSLLQYHALPSYAPIDTLKSSKGSRLATLAPPGKYGLTASVSGGNNTVVHTGIVNATVIATVLDSAPVVIFSVDTVLMPVALFGNFSPPAEAPAPETEAPTPVPVPAPEPTAKSPRPAKGPVASPPAPAADEGGDGDGDGGEAESPDNSDDGNTKNNSGAKGNGSLCMGGLISLVCWVIMFVM